MSRFWIFKSEPGEYSISDFEKEGKTLWTGVRNYQARNYMRGMSVGEKIFFYHSSCPQPGIVGMGEVSQEAISEETSDKGDWSCVELAYLKTFSQLLSLESLRDLDLGECPLTRKGNRLSIIPLSEEQAHRILQAVSV